MLAGVRDYMIVCTEEQKPLYVDLLGNGQQFGIKIKYTIQPKPNGIPEAFLLCEDFIAGEPVWLILGDNLFVGDGLTDLLQKISDPEMVTIFLKHVSEPRNFGVVELDNAGEIVSMVEKPTEPTSSLAITGLYKFGNTVCELARDLTPSSRGELEIVDLLKLYHEARSINHVTLGRGFSWLDTGTFENLSDASQLIRSIQNSHSLSIGCLEEIAIQSGWVDRSEVLEVLAKMPNNIYYDYVREIVKKTDLIKGW